MSRTQHRKTANSQPPPLMKTKKTNELMLWHLLVSDVCRQSWRWTDRRRRSRIGISFATLTTQCTQETALLVRQLPRLSYETRSQHFTRCLRSRLQHKHLCTAFPFVAEMSVASDCHQHHDVFPSAVNIQQCCW